jgi:hypothetical protein
MIRSHYDIVCIECDACLNEEFRGLEEQETISIVIAQALDMGWKRITENGEDYDYCPRCAKDVQ